MIKINQSILITGVAGFIGRYVARYFYQQGWSIIGIDSASPENAGIANLTNYYSLRLPDPKLANILQITQPQLCIHCAGRASVGLSVTDPQADFYSNTIVTFEILNSLRLNSPKCKFIFLSSAAVYGNPQTLPIKENDLISPISPYGFHKWQSEQICLEFAQIYQIPTTSVRIFSAYGAGLRRQVLWDMCYQAINQKTLNLQGTGTESRDFIHVADIAQALEIIAEKAPMTGEVYNLACGEEVAISDLAELILKSLNYQIKPQFNGIVGAGNPLNWQGDITKIQQLGFQPKISLEQGVKSFVNWCRAELLEVQ